MNRKSHHKTGRPPPENRVAERSATAKSFEKLIAERSATLF